MAKKKLPRLTIVYAPCGDWEGIYADGELIEQGHSLRLDLILEHLGFQLESKECDDDWITDCGSLPKNLEEVKFSEEEQS